MSPDEAEKLALIWKAGNEEQRQKYVAPHIVDWVASDIVRIALAIDKDAGLGDDGASVANFLRWCDNQLTRDS